MFVVFGSRGWGWGWGEDTPQYFHILIHVEVLFLWISRFAWYTSYVALNRVVTHSGFRYWNTCKDLVVSDVLKDSQLLYVPLTPGSVCGMKHKRRLRICKMGNPSGYTSVFGGNGGSYATGLHCCSVSNHLKYRNSDLKEMLTPPPPPPTHTHTYLKAPSLTFSPPSYSSLPHHASLPIPPLPSPITVDLPHTYRDRDA